MVRSDELLRTANLLRRLDRVVKRKLPDRRGWVLIDAYEPAQQTWVHVRPYLREPGLPTGYRIVESSEGSLPRVTGAEGDLPIFVRGESSPFAPEVNRFCQDQEENELLPWLIIKPAGGGDKVVFFDRDGHRHSLPRGAQAIQAARPRIDLRGTVKHKISKYLPMEISVESPTPRALLGIGLKDAPGLDTDLWVRLEEPENQPLGRGVVRLDVTLDAFETDEILPSHQGFTGRVRQEEFNSIPDEDCEPVYHEGEVCLHVLYDRTSLDANGWLRAFAAVTENQAPWRSRMPAGEQDAYATDEPSDQPAAEDLNLPLREAVAEALGSSLDALHHDVKLDLWWFADTRREGIDSSGILPVKQKSHDRVGRCAPNRIAALGYASGIDLFDAADEALHEVTRIVAESVEERREQHGVLIIGDSPPPPAGHRDPLWRMLVEEPERTNARRSPHFVESLARLTELGVPVGWVFPRGDDTVDVEMGLKKYLADYQDYQSLKERILEALRRFENLRVGACVNLEDLDRAFRDVLRQMSRRGSETTRFRILKR